MTTNLPPLTQPGPRQFETAAVLQHNLLAAVAGYRAAGNRYLSQPRGSWRVFRGLPDQVGAVRRFVRAQADGHAAAEDAVLIGSELASNAISHTASGHQGGMFLVHAPVLDDSHVAVAVTDQGSDREPAVMYSAEERGRGLVIVTALSVADLFTFGGRHGRTIIAIAGIAGHAAR